MAIPHPFRIDYARDGEVLRAHVTGVDGNLANTLAYWRALAAEVRRRQPRALLVVDDLDGEPLSPEELAQLVQALVGQGLEGVRVAYVERHTQRIAEVEYAEILARELGFDARVFASEANALIWLRHGAH